MSISGGPDIIEDGLVLCLDAADDSSYISGSSTWYDISGNGNNGTLTNGPTYNTGSKGSIVFDGVDDYIVGSLISAPTEMTLCVFAKVTNKDEAGLIGIGTAGTYKEFWIELRSSGNFKVGLYSDDLSTGWSLSQSYASLWTYFCGTINSAKLQTGYINGRSVGTYQGSNAYSGNSNYRVGLGRYSGGTYVNGNIAVAHIYNRALSSNEILQNYNSIKGRYNL